MVQLYLCKLQVRVDVFWQDYNHFIPDLNLPVHENRRVIEDGKYELNFYQLSKYQKGLVLKFTIEQANGMPERVEY